MIGDDTLTGLLGDPRARGAFLLRSVLSPPWSMRIEDRAPLTMITLAQGSAWIVAGAERRELVPGNVALIRGPEPYVVADDPSTAPQVVINPDQSCSWLVEDRSELTVDPATRTWQVADDGSTVLLSGTYQMHSEIGRRLLDALPSLVVQPIRDEALIGLLAEEIGIGGAGQELVLDRLLDLVLVKVVRSWLASPDAGAPAWYRAQRDPSVGTALRLMHEDPAHPWTVAELATRAGVSRAALARNFSALVGEPPMNYLTGWRLAMAADLFRDSRTTIEAVARQVGYSSSFALSSAFKRVHGVSPQQYRDAALSGSTPRESPRP